MTLTRKLNYKTHKKTRRQNGGGRFRDFLRSFFTKKPDSPSSGVPPPPPPIPADIVRLFNAKMLWKITPNSTYYDVLNVASDADDAVINKAFTRNIALHIHPDKLPDAEKIEYGPVFQAVGEMRNILMNPVTRAQYDALLRMYPPSAPPVPPRPGSSGGPPDSSGGPLGSSGGPPGSSGGPPVPPSAGPAPGLDLSFMVTQQPNPLERQKSGPIPRPIIGTRVGGVIQNFIQDINNMIGDGRLQSDNPRVVSILKFGDNMLDYPESSNLENYIIFIELFLSYVRKIELINILNATLIQNSQKTIGSKIGLGSSFNLLDAVQLPSPGVATDPTKIIPARLLSLMVLSSRLCPIYKLRVNPEAELFNRLNQLFNGGDGTNFDSEGIFNIFQAFISENPIVTNEYIVNLINGKTAYDIYKRNYLKASTDISEKLIKTRLDVWLRDNDSITTPVSFLFNKNSNTEKARINSDAAICQIIADFSDKIGKPTTPKTLLPKSVFNVDENDSVDFDKLNEFLKKLGPPAAVKRPKKGKSPTPP